MKLNFDSDRSEWSIPDAELNTALSKAVTKYELEKTTKAQSRRFWLSLAFCVPSIAGATAIIVLGNFAFFPLIAAGVMYGAAYEILKSYLEIK